MTGSYFTPPALASLIAEEATYDPAAGTGGFLLANPPWAPGTIHTQMPMPHDPAADLEAAFRAWWAESFPSAPPGPHAVRSHVAFAQWVLAQQGTAEAPDGGDA